MNVGDTIPRYLRVSVIRKYQSLEVEFPPDLSQDNKLLAWKTCDVINEYIYSLLKQQQQTVTE